MIVDGLQSEALPLWFLFFSFEYENLPAYFVVGFVLVVILYSFLTRKSKNAPIKIALERDLGMWTNRNEEIEKTLRQLIHHLEHSIDPQYKKQIGQFLQVDKKMHPAEFERRWFEWKRFLILATLIPSIQMYSDEVDKIWHQMLLFTKEYDDFSKRFFGFRFGHQPNLPDRKPASHDEHVWFSFLYFFLFKDTGSSTYIWRLGYRGPVSYEKLDDFRHLSVEELAKKHFFSLAQQRNPLVAKLTKQIIEQIKAYIHEIDDHVANHGKSSRFYKEQLGDILSASPEELNLRRMKIMLFFSLYHRERFLKYGAMVDEETQVSSESGQTSNKSSRKAESKSDPSKSSPHRNSGSGFGCVGGGGGDSSSCSSSSCSSSNCGGSSCGGSSCGGSSGGSSCGGSV